MTSPALHAQIGAFKHEAWSLQFGRFLGVGLLGLATDLLAFTVLHSLGWSPAAARACSLAIATIVTWTLNRRFTFAATGRRKRLEMGRYAAVVVFAQGISYATFLALVATAPALPAQGALLVGAVAATAFSFLGQRLFTFAPAPSLQESRA